MTNREATLMERLRLVVISTKLGPINGQMQVLKAASTNFGEPVPYAFIGTGKHSRTLNAVSCRAALPGHHDSAIT